MTPRCLRMTAATIQDAFGLLHAFLSEDEYYAASRDAYGDRGGAALREALSLFLERPDLGFVWLAYLDSRPTGVCVISFAISTSTGSIVAKLDDLYVTPEHRSSGVGAALVGQLLDDLKSDGVLRIDTSVHIRNVNARRFYDRLGFRPLGEERLAHLL